MKKLKVGFFILFIFSGCLVLLSFTRGFFTDSSKSSGNVFSASDIFPTKSVTVIVTINPTVTVTPTITVTETVTQIPTPTPSPTPVSASHIVISEVQINGATTAQDFIELYNPTDSEVDLNGWKIRKKTSTGSESSLVVIDSDRLLVSRGFFLWSNNSNGFNTSVGADVSNTNTLAGDNSIVLLKADNSTVDRLAWGSGTNQFVEASAFPDNPGAGQSLERKANVSSNISTMSPGGSDELKGNGFDSNNNSADFILRTLSQPQNSSSNIEAE